MSLDLYLVENKCDKCGRSDEVFEGNYTYNCAKMWRVVYPDESMVEIDGMTGRQAEPKLTKIIEHMDSNRSAYEALNPENGWGSASGFRDFLIRVRKACREYPGSVWESWR